jgi:hypothetical protein
MATHAFLNSLPTRTHVFPWCAFLALLTVSGESLCVKVDYNILAFDLLRNAHKGNDHGLRSVHKVRNVCLIDWFALSRLRGGSGSFLENGNNVSVPGSGADHFNRNHDNLSQCTNSDSKLNPVQAASQNGMSNDSAVKNQNQAKAPAAAGYLRDDSPNFCKFLTKTSSVLPCYHCHHFASRSLGNGSGYARDGALQRGKDMFQVLSTKKQSIRQRGWFLDKPAAYPV